MTQDNHNSPIVRATFIIIAFAHLGSSEDILIPATISMIKHTMIITEAMILVNAHIITGNALVSFTVVVLGSLLSLVLLSVVVFIQFHIRGNSVFNLIHLQSQSA